MSFLGNTKMSELSATEKVIYNYLVANFAKIPAMHLRDIAHEAHAGASSVARLIRKMGYESYLDLQKFVKTQQQKEMVENDAFRLLSVDNYTPELIDKCRQLVEKINQSDKIIFFGLGNSGAIGRCAARRFATLSYDAVSITDATYPIASQLTHKNRYLLIALSISGETNEVIEVLRNVRNRENVSIVSITPNGQSTLADLSDLSINYKVEEHRINLYGDMTSQIPALFITEVVSDMIVSGMNEQS